MNSLTLNALRPPDLPKAIEYVRTYYAHDHIPYEERVTQGISQLLSQPSFGWFFEIVVDETGIGYVVLTIGFDHEIGGPFGLITDFYLREESRGLGLGSRVIQEVERVAREADLGALELVVLGPNARGRRFYERLGFEAWDDRTMMFKYLDRSNERYR